MIRNVRILCLLVLTVAFGAAPHARAACVSQSSRSAVAYVVDNPQEFLNQYPRAGDNFSSVIVDLASGTDDNRRMIVVIAGKANAMQKRAIGQALQTIRPSCLRESPGLARKIERLVRDINDRDVTRAFGAGLIDDSPAPRTGATTDDSPGARRTLSLDPSVPLRPYDPTSPSPLPLPGASIDRPYP
jgi:hypothetical protein